MSNIGRLSADMKRRKISKRIDFSFKKSKWYKQRQSAQMFRKNLKTLYINVFYVLASVVGKD